MSAKTTKCPVCNGSGKRYILNNGTVINSEKCRECSGTGKVKVK